MGEKPTEADEASGQREAGSGLATGFAIGEEGVQKTAPERPPREEAVTSNLNLSKSNREAAGGEGDRRIVGEAIESPGPAEPGPGPAGDGP